MKPKKGRMVSVYFEKYAPKNGFYIEIGAYDGVSKNSTKILEAHGWNGVCVEAHPERFKKLEQNRNCRCVNCAIWCKTGTVDFAIMPEKKRGWDGIVKTLPPRAKEYLNESKIVEIKSLTWNDLNLPTHIDYLQIDVEGAELYILETIDFSKYTIDYICLEDNNYSISNGKDLTYKIYMEKIGYKCVEVLHVDHLYTRV